MRKVDYLLKEQFIDIDQLAFKNKLLRPVGVTIGTIITISYFLGLGILLPTAFFMDQARAVKYWAIKNDRLGVRKGNDLIISDKVVTKGFWRSKKVLTESEIRKISKVVLK